MDPLLLAEHADRVFSVRTARTYTHVVVGMRHEAGDFPGEWEVVGWCGRPDLADKKAAAARKEQAFYPPRGSGRRGPKYAEVEILAVRREHE